ncbi:MAG: hypothetical protein HY846_07970 [Nitrosomonadales bacterium]|nr:hypothetical protein [Nitrosomonadales bacterium]
MQEKIRLILNKITALEDELRRELHEQESRLFYRIEDGRIKFEQAIREAHQQLKVGVFRWFLTVRPQNFLTAPIIYSLIVPLVFFDLCVTFYQVTCFPIYGIPRVRRSDYVVMDHQHLAYLNVIEKIHCLYCSYGNGVIAYAREITARTEQYFCPIRHAQKLLEPHERYARFLDYGEAEDFHARLEEFRKALAEEKERAKGG